MPGGTSSAVGVTAPAHDVDLSGQDEADPNADGRGTIVTPASLTARQRLEILHLDGLYDTDNLVWLVEQAATMAAGKMSAADAAQMFGFSKPRYEGLAALGALAAAELKSGAPTLRNAVWTAIDKVRFP